MKELRSIVKRRNFTATAVTRTESGSAHPRVYGGFRHGQREGSSPGVPMNRLLVFAETAPTLSLSTASLDRVVVGRQSGMMDDKTAAPFAATDSILRPGDEGDHLSPVVERLDCHSLGSIGPAWLGRQGRGGRKTLAGN
jgi:hypothetical protein